MKKLFVLLALVATICFGSFCVSAEEPEPTEPPAAEPPVEETTEPVAIDYEKLASDVYDKVKGEISEEGIAGNIVEILSKWDETDKEGATFASRLSEFFTADNLVSTVSMLFMVVVGIIIFAMKKSQGLSIISTNEDLKKLKERLEEEIKNGSGLSGSVQKLIDTIDTITKNLTAIEEKIDGRQNSADEAKAAAIGVANMLRDIFMNSKTIDEAGKKIMNVDYLKAIGEPITGEAPDEPEQKEEV